MRNLTPNKTFAEFFAGVGLVAEGLRPGVWVPTYANDINPDKHRLYTAFHGPAPYFHRQDIWQTESILERLGTPPVLATASFPCTDLSTAGLYKGFAGKHSSAFFGFTEILRRLGNRRPPLVMLENVPGFLTARKGQDFADAAAELASLGYRLDVLLVDASHFVPQSRERLFVIGRSAEAFPRLGTSKAPVSDARPRRLLELVKRIPLATGWDLVSLPPLPQRSIKIKHLIGVGKEEKWWPRMKVDKHVTMMNHRHRPQVQEAQLRDSLLVMTGFRRTRPCQCLEVRFDGLAGCLRTARGGSSRQIVVVAGRDKVCMRSMSPAEYALLQGYERPLPKYSTTQLLNAFGDAVCVPVISWIDRHLLTPAAEMLTSRSASVA